MDKALLDSIEAAAAAAPMVRAASVPGRVLFADGDGLAYSCAGSDATDPGESRDRLLLRLDEARRASGASDVVVLLTGQSSHKGYRYAVAARAPYQGKRASSRRPRNWEYLRRLMEDGDIPFPVDITFTSEADDLFAKHSKAHGWDKTVIYTEDKDMRMVPGLHLDWKDYVMHPLPEGTFESEFNGKVYGEKWFWLQCLQGDSTDNIPGLPFFRAHEGAKLARVGPVTAAQALAPATCRKEALEIVLSMYGSFYDNGRAEVELLEQGILLWMRNDQQSWFLNVCQDGNPMEALRWASFEIVERVHRSVGCH
jgi:DNA polymerase-1